jgi:hypothetical protein
LVGLSSAGDRLFGDEQVEPASQGKATASDQPLTNGPRVLRFNDGLDFAVSFFAMHCIGDFFPTGALVGYSTGV